jgi:predicted nucleic acid-binding protein
MSVYTALLDANVLYPAPLRDIFIQLALTDIYHAKWSATIHDEWMRSLLRDKPSLDRAVPQRTRDLMDRAVSDCLVTGYEALIPALTLPDPDDRHVLAAAIAGRCDVIVTQNLRHFPAEALAPYGSRPSTLTTSCPIISISRPVSSARSSARSAPGSKIPPFTAEQYLAVLTQQGLVATASDLAQFSGLI